MPMYEYECPKKHAFTIVVVKPSADEPKETRKCEMCKRTAVLQASTTGTPILKAGCGGFYRPNAR